MNVEEGKSSKSQGEKNDDEDYDPHLNRNLKNPTTNFDTLVHLLKGCIGTGILALPEGFKLAGMINAIVCTTLIGIFTTYLFHMLVRSQYMLCKRKKVGLLPYPDSMKVACEVGPECLRKFAPYAGGLTNFFLIFYQLGVLCVYIVFMGVNFKTVFDKYTDIILTFYILMFFLPCLLFMCIKNLKVLSPLSVFGNIVTLITFGVIWYYVCQDLPHFNSRPAFGDWRNYPLYFGTALFAIQSVPVVVALENNMATPKKFLEPFGVLNVGFAIVTTIYVLVATMGYWKYGEEIKSSITLNFPATEAVGQAVRVLYALAICFSFALNGIIPIEILWNDYIGDKFKEATETRKLVYQYILRIIVVVVTFLLAMVVPLLGLFISLVGGLCLSAVGIVFPALIEICALWPDGLGRMRWILWKDIVIMFIGIVGLILSCYASIRDIYTELAAGNTIGAKMSRGE